MKQCDILACYGNTWVDKLITKVTGDRVTHIAMVYNDELIFETQWFGVSVTPLKDKWGNYYVLRYEGLTEDQARGIVDFLIRTIGKGYDYKQFLSVGLFKLFGVKVFENNKKKFLCAELIVDAYASVGIDIVPHVVDKDNLLPEDLMESPVLTHIYPIKRSI